MKKALISLGFAALALGATAQVKIKDGTVTGSSTTPNSNAILELESNNKGLLYPRVSLTATNTALPGTTMVAGMVVYNTNTTTGANGVTPGFYYSDGTQWIQLVSSNSLPASTVFIYGAGTPAAAGATCNSGAQNTIYVDTGSTSATLGQTWICDGTNWQNYNAPASTAWYLAGSATADAGANKIAAISRSGSVVIGYNASPASVASATSGSSAAQQLAGLTVGLHDANINGITIGRGGGQIVNNTAIGYGTLYSNTTGSNNTAVGYQSFVKHKTGNNNTAVGFATLYSDTTGTGNTAIGFEALYNQMTGSNTAVGFNALYSHKTGGSNTAVGYNSLYTDTTGTSNTAIGHQALYNSTGNGNIALGYFSANNQRSGNNNIAIGYNVSLPNTAGNYQLNIGNAIWGTGVDSTTTNAANIGINTPTPTSTFYVNGSQGGRINVQSASYGLSPTDYTVVFTGGAAVTATLPPATGISGRMYRIVASGTGTTVTVFSTSGTVMLLPTITTLTGQSAIFQSNGTTWYQVQ